MIDDDEDYDARPLSEQIAEQKLADLERQESAQQARGANKTRSAEAIARTQERARIEHRDAHDRASQITNPAEARDIYRKAERRGDFTLANAIRTTAETKNWNLNMHKPEDVAASININLRVAVDEHNDRFANIRDDLKRGLVKDEYIRTKNADALDSFATSLNEQATAARQLVSDSEAEFSAALAQLTAPTGDTNQQLLDEIRGGKSWDRITRELDGKQPADKLGTIVQKLATASPAETRAILDEAPSYLAGAGIADAHTLLTEAIVHASPDLQAARARLTHATKIRDVTQHNVETITAKLTSPRAFDGTIGNDILDVTTITAHEYQQPQGTW